MKRQTELWLVTGLLLLAAILRIWHIAELPPGFTTDELAYIDITESVREGNVAVYYLAPDGTARAGMYGVPNSLLTGLTGDGLIGYRLLPLISGLITLALLYALARRLFGVPVALAALVAGTINMRLILLSRTGSAEALMPLYVVLTLLMLAVAFNLRATIRFHTPGTVPFAVLGLLFGATGYLHYTGLVLGPLGALFAAHVVLTRQPLSRRIWSAGLFVVVLATIIGMPYVISTLREPADSELYTYWAERPAGLRDLVDGALHAVGGVFWQGDPRVTHSVAEMPLVGPLLALLLIVGLAEAIRRWRDPRYALLGLALLFGLLADTWVQPDTTFSANLVAYPAILILPAVGARVLVQGLAARGVQGAWQPIASLFVVLLAINVIVVRERFYDDWAGEPAVKTAYNAELARVARYLDQYPDGLPVSFCTTRLNEPGPSGLTPRGALDAMLHHDDIEMRHSDCRAGIVLINAGAPMRYIFGSEADRDVMPPELREWFADADPIPVEGLAEGTVLRLDVEQRLRDAGGQWAALAPAYYMPDENGPGERVALPAPLDDHLTFAGYDPRALRSPRVAGSDPIVLVTYWRVDGSLPEDLGIFAHLLAYPDNETDEAARIPLLEPWAESNTIDVVPAELEPRDFFIQVSYLWLAENLKPAEYALTVGAYTDSVAVLDNHLLVLDVVRDYQPHGDRFLLGNLRIEAPETAPEQESSPADTAASGG